MTSHPHGVPYCCGLMPIFITSWRASRQLLLNLFMTVAEYDIKFYDNQYWCKQHAGTVKQLSAIIFASSTLFSSLCMHLNLSHKVYTKGENMKVESYRSLVHNLMFCHLSFRDDVCAFAESTYSIFDLIR